MSTLFVIDGCTFTGAINGYGSGGIIGSMSSNIKITNCSSSGSIRGGGIAGTLAGVTTSVNSGLVEIIDCFSSGDIGSIGLTEEPITKTNLASFAGGIVADYASNIKITRCYSFGEIGAMGKNSCGGIIGAFAGSNGGSIKIDRCFSLGNIFDNCGGIADQNFGVYSGKIHVIKLCYSLGNIGNNAGGIAGPNIGPGYSNYLNYDYKNDSNNSVFLGVGYGKNASSGSPNRNAFINILGCCSYGNLANNYSGGIIARTTQAYPVFLTNKNFYLKMITIYKCINYGKIIVTSAINSSYQNFVNTSYENIYINNIIIGGDSSIPPVQGIFNETITEYNGDLLYDINNNVYDIMLKKTNLIAKNRINTGLYLDLSVILPKYTLTPTQCLLLSYNVNDILLSNISIYDILNTTTIKPSDLIKLIGGNFTINSMLTREPNVLDLLINKFKMPYWYLFSHGLKPITLYNSGYYNILWFKNTLAWTVSDYLNNGFSLMNLFPSFTIFDFFKDGYTINLFYENNISARDVSLIPDTKLAHFTGSKYTLNDIITTRWNNTPEFNELGYNIKYKSIILPDDSSYISDAIRNLPNNFKAQDVQNN